MSDQRLPPYPDFDDKTHRICAMCLEVTPRDTYDDHMQAHGYKTVKAEDFGAYVDSGASLHGLRITIR